MLSRLDKATTINCAKKYNTGAIYLFGSSLDRRSEANDIDLAVESIEPKYFFKFHGELLRLLSKPVDLVDLSQRSLFNKLVKEKGVKIYG